MIARILVALLFSAMGWGACTSPYCSAVIPPTTSTANISTNNFASPTCAGASCMTFVFRIHNFNWTSRVNANPIVSAGGFGVTYFGGNGITNAVFFNSPDVIPIQTGNCDVPGTIPNDIQVKATRDIANSMDRFEVWNTQTGTLIGTCNFVVSSFASDAAIRAQGIQVGGTFATQSGGDLAYVRWQNSITPAGVSPRVGQSSTARWLDYEYDSAPGSKSDTSGIGGQSLSGSFTYVNTPIYSPACTPFSLQTFRVGMPAVLNADDNCYALNGSPALTYAWSPITGADGVSQDITIIDPTAAITETSNLTRFGSANFQLTVTDSDMQSTAVNLHYGAVFAAPEGQINLAAEGLTAAQQFIAGPQIMFGASPWSFADDRIAASLKLQLCNLMGGAGCGSQFYAPFWRSYAPGTITLIQGSANVVGAGTTFRATYGGGTTTPVGGASLVWQYTGTDGVTNHFTHANVVSITDDTHMTITLTYPASPNAPWPSCATGCAGLSYSEYDNSTVAYNDWLYTPAPGNYYDVVQFAKVNYWRSGIDLFNTLAQTEAQYWMEWPLLDYYYNCNFQINNLSPGNGSCFAEARSYALTGMILQEQDPGNAYLLPAVENIGNLYTFLLGLLPTAVGLNDIRDDAYELSGVSLLALVDPTYSSQKWQTTIKTVVNGAFTTTKDAQGAGTGWQLPYTTGGPEYTSYAASGGCACSVAVVNGSPIIAGTGTSWAADLVGQSIWTYGGGANTLPPTNSVGDAKSYIIQSVNSPTSITLSENYAGATASGRGFFTGVSSGLVGWGFQPFMEFHLGQAFYFCAQAMIGYDAQTQARCQFYGHDAVSAAVGGVAPSTGGQVNGGLYNGLYYPGCSPGMLSTATNGQLYCYGASGFYPGTGPTSPSQNRTLATEAMRAIALDYQNFGTNLATGTLLMNQMFCAPGYTCLGTPDGFFLSDYLDGGTFLTSQQSKWTGELGGYTGGATAWPGIEGLLRRGRTRIAGPAQAKGAVVIK